MAHGSSGHAAPDLADRRRRARRLRDYFDLQLRFATAVSELQGLRLDQAVAHYTNFHARFGLGRIDGEARSTHWTEYTEGLSPLPSLEQRVDWTQDFFVRSPAEQPPVDQQHFGCFSFERPDREGRIRIHFANRDSAQGTGPLAAKKIPHRTSELKRLFTHVAQHFPTAGQVRGGSWLYHLEAYRRLFPPSYTASATLPIRDPRFHGTSSWGQFLDHRERVRTDRRAAFLANLPGLRAGQLRHAFPLPALLVHAPLSDFYAFYEIGSD